jgi:hypothetical protein
MSESQTDPKTLEATIDMVVALDERYDRLLGSCQQVQNELRQIEQLVSTILGDLTHLPEIHAQYAQERQRRRRIRLAMDQIYTWAPPDHTPDT